MEKDMQNSKQVLQNIRDSIYRGKLRDLEKYCRISLQLSDLNETDQRLVRRGFMSIARIYDEEGSYKNAIINCEYARKIIPQNYMISIYEINLIKKLYDEKKDRYTELDRNILIDIIDFLIEPYQNLKSKSKYKKVVNEGNNIKIEISDNFLRSSGKKDSNDTKDLKEIRNNILSLKFQHLDEEEREIEICKYLSKGLIKYGYKKGIVPSKGKTHNVKTQKGN